MNDLLGDLDPIAQVEDGNGKAFAIRELVRNATLWAAIREGLSVVNVLPTAYLRRYVSSPRMPPRSCEQARGKQCEEFGYPY